LELDLLEIWEMDSSFQLRIVADVGLRKGTDCLVLSLPGASLVNEDVCEA
jgi:hypothetical protein